MLLKMKLKNNKANELSDTPIYNLNFLNFSK